MENNNNNEYSCSIGGRQNQTRCQNRSNYSVDAIQRKKFKEKENNSQVYGFVYLVTNKINGKVYIGQTSYPRTIEIEWKSLVDQGNRLRNMRETDSSLPIKTRYILNAIAKYNECDWVLTLVDIAFSKDELNEKERYYIKLYDSMNKEKGYNMTEGGEGTKGLMKEIPELKKFLTDIKTSTVQEEVLKIYNVDRGTMNKWLSLISGKLSIKNYSTIKSLLQDKDIDTVVLEFSKLQKGEYSKFLDLPIVTPNNNEITKELWKNKDYQQRVNEGRENLYKTEEFQKKHSEIQHRIWESQELRIRQSENTKFLWDTNFDFKVRALDGLEQAHKCRRKPLADIKEFLRVIKDSKDYKDVTERFNINHPYMQRKIKSVLDPFGVDTYTGAKIFLANRDIDCIFNELDEMGHIKKLIDLGHFNS